MNKTANRRSKIWGVLLFLPLLALVAGCNEDDVERTLGRQTSAAVEKEYGVSNDPVLGEWVNTLGQKLVGQSPRQHIVYNFKVLNTDMVNAFAAPWGYIYLTRGMLNFAKSEDEVAFVLAHEIGHVTGRHSIKSVKKNVLFSIGSALLGAKSEGLGNLSGLGAGMMLLHYSRDNERYADMTGSSFSFGGGYDPQGGIEFFTRLMNEMEKERPSSIEHLFLTHPPTANRIALTKTRPELNLKSADTAYRIGRSYGRRHAYGTAAKYYRMAVAEKPEVLQPRLDLAEAYSQVGRYDAARETYQAILQTRPEQPQVLAALQSLERNQGGFNWPQIAQAEQQQAQAALKQIATTESEVGSVTRQAQGFLQSSVPQVANAAGIAKQSISGLLGMADMQVELSDNGKGAFVLANGAVSAANGAVFTLEAVNKDVARVSGLLQAGTPKLRAGLQQAAAGKGLAGDAAAYQRALHEMRQASAEMSRIMNLTRQLNQEVQETSIAGSKTVALMETMLKSKKPDDHIYPVQQAAKETRQRAEAALAATAKTKQMTMVAEARALLARLNLAALGTSPEVRNTYDGMVAYYCMTNGPEVTRLRSQGLGYGDAAFVLMASHGNQAKPEDLRSLVESQAIVDGLQARQMNFDAPVVLLKFLLGAMEREAAALGG
jgi:predicted Zn-dependent protease